MSQGIYAQLLGEDFARLQPEVQEYFSLAPGSGYYGLGTGVFDVAGCPQAWLRPFLRLSASEQAFFPEYGEQVPFQIENHSHIDPFGRPSLTARRTLSFPAQQRVFEDTSSIVDGRLIDYVGKHHRLATELSLSVAADRKLRAVSHTSRLFTRQLKLRLPAALDAKAYTLQWWDAEAGKHRIQVKVIHPQIGLILVYAGGFDYQLKPYPAHEAAAHGVPSRLPHSAQPQRWETRS
ncbi:DUF4166 domain-containing protein [Psychromicrobium lacuslunae]|uniref:DUF4166 domain-containing protein n=1 Tax=Psychromicrobium lacuslunae TaxID=1618207 RepID=A0A0D4BYA5_9MICC|nr:DUF4166 domain-containing protein [Psychromicrobium lacuslunae]AJT41447.1 hypothetical protein UM93_07825 [Psychromicrobium lacuslunae]